MWNEMAMITLMSELDSNKELQSLLRTSRPSNSSLQHKKRSNSAAEMLNYEQIKQFIYTSPAINACISKKDFQRNVNQVQNEVVQSLELDIANEILKHYKQY